MDIFKKIELLNKINILLEEEVTGSPLELSKKLKISRSQLYRIINFLKTHGAPIKYSRLKRSFYYTQAYQFPIEITMDNSTKK